MSHKPALCPLCGQVHDRCVFTAGSLYCAVGRCRNPHHRPPPDDVTEEPRRSNECGECPSDRR
jgi:hypothetical protein